MDLKITRRMRIGTLAFMVVFGCFAQAVNAAVVLSALSSPDNTVAPPGTLGGYTMTALAQSYAPRQAQVSSTLGALSIGFNQTVLETNIGPAPKWIAWSHGYTGNVWSTVFSTNALSVTLTLPTGTKALYFFAQPEALSDQPITVTYSGATGSPLTLSIDGNGGAKGFGLYSDAGEDLTQFTISSVSASVGFAVGEFGIFNSGAGSVVPEPTSMAIFGLSGLALIARRMRTKRRVGAC
jgi:hypothetical protein